MHQRSKSSQLQGMEEGAGMIRSSSSEWGAEMSSSSSASNSASDSFNMALLIILYAMQGVPLGLSLGSIPFILKSHATYTEVGVFSLAAYPYSMKLLWSPIVDTVFSSKIGWRKSWVLPMQMASGLLMIFSARTADHWLETANIHSITMLFFVFILLAATQDIAVDGILTLSKYFYFWGWFYIITTILLLYKSEKPHHNTQILNTSPGHSRSDFHKSGEVADERRHVKDGLYSLGPGSLDDRVAGTLQRMGVERMYKRLWALVTLPNIRLLTTILLISKLGSITAEAVSVFKLMEKGVTREVVSLVVLIEFPLELIFAIFAGRWASKGRPFTPWLTGYYLRLAMAAVSTLLVALFPVGATLRSAPFFYVLIILSGVLTSFASTMMFVAQGTFFSRISDSSMGGTYLTLLNTIANFGSAWPKFFVFILLDMLTVQQCVDAKVELGGLALSCTSKKGSTSSCKDAGGTCVTTLDGFYPLSFGMVLVGAVIGQLCYRRLRELEMSKEAAWRA